MNKLKKLSIIFLLILSTLFLCVGCVNSTPQSFSVTFVQEGQANIVKQVENGGTLTDIPTPVQEEGYNIVWEKTDFSNITKDLQVNAIKKSKNYQLTLDYGGHPVSYPNKMTVAYKKGFALPPITSPWGTFVKWTLESGEDFNDKVYNYTKDITIKAVWDCKKVELVFVQDGYDNVVKTVDMGSSLEDIPTPVQEDGYTIVWNKTDFSSITENTTVTSIKTPNTYEITLDFNGVETQEETVITVTYGKEFYLPTPISDDYSFIKWITVDDEQEFTNGIYTLTTGLSLKAVWGEKVIPQAQDYVDFVVDVEEGREIRVLQLTDIQTLDASQTRYQNRGVGTTACDVFDRYHKYIGQVIESYKPDLIIMTGDNVYGEFDDSGKRHLELIEIMDSYKIPWAPIFGNHDNESNMGVDWQCEQFVKSEYCLFKQRTLTGNGNYSVGITQGGELKRVFYMLDSNGCYNMSAKSFANGHSKKSVGFGNDQIEWYTQSMKEVAKFLPNAKFSMAFHIQLSVFGDALKKYGYDSNTIKANPINLDNLASATDKGDFGYIGRQLKDPWDTNHAVWNGIKTLGVDSIFVGHEHCNSASVIYEGVRLTYGQKSSTFDRYNCKESDGTYKESYNDNPVMGGTFINLSSDGSIADAGIIYYDKTVGYQKPEQSTPSDDKVSMDNIPADATVTTLDFNDIDFDLTSSNSSMKWQNATLLDDTSTVPAGFTGSVSAYTGNHTASTGIIFNQSVYSDNILGVFVRLYIGQHGIESAKSPLIRIYDNENNVILTEKSFSSLGGKYDEWIYLDVLSLIKSTPSILSDGKILPFTLVYRYYGTTTSTIYFDSISIISNGSPYEKPNNTNPTSTTPYNTKYYEYTLEDFNGSITLLSNQKTLFQINEKSYALSFKLNASTFNDTLTIYGYTQDGTSGIKITISNSEIKIGRETVTLPTALLPNTAYDFKIGFASLYDGNTVYAFVMINGTRVCWELVESYGKTVGNLSIATSSNSITLS